MPAKSKNQQRAAGAALSAKRGETDPSELKGASKQMYDSMSEEQLRHYAETPTKDLPEEKDDKEAEAKCPGGKIRSGGMGRGLGRGRGLGPMGVPIGERLRAIADDDEKEDEEEEEDEKGKIDDEDPSGEDERKEAARIVRPRSSGALSDAFIAYGGQVKEGMDKTAMADGGCRVPMLDNQREALQAELERLEENGETGSPRHRKVARRLKNVGLSKFLAPGSRNFTYEEFSNS